MKNRETVTRREFVKSTSLGIGTATLGAALLGPSELAHAVTTQQLKWAKTMDVVVVGAGAAGFSAAIEAAKAGAKVLMLEKGQKVGGTTYRSAGVVLCPKTAEDAAAYLKAVAHPEGSSDSYELDDEHALVWASEAVKNPDWLKSIGAPELRPLFKGWYDVPGQQNFISCMIGRGGIEGGGGAALIALMDAAATKLNIEKICEAPVVELVTRPGTDGPVVIGVIADIKGKKTAIRALKGVILACGGFEANPPLRKNYLAAGLVTVAPATNTGDAISLTAKVEAAMWHLNNACMMPAHEVPDIGEYTASAFAMLGGDSQIFVNKHGKRFMDECIHAYDMKCRIAAAYDPVRHEYPSNPFWLVFDETRRLRGQAGTGIPEKYRWSHDNSEEIRKGWILKADTIAELAKLMKLDPVTLEKTVNTYNQNGADEKDPEFGRTEGLTPITKGPFYALKTFPAVFSAGGGPRTNTRAQVLNVHGKVVPGLYAAGASSWVAIAFVYPLSGSSIAEGMVTGRIAGLTAGSSAKV